jgi:hypothetical protein
MDDFTRQPQTLRDMANTVHAANKKWWTDLKTGAPLDRNWGEMCMLVVSELAEAMEGDRKNLMDDKLPHRKMFEVELADALIRVLDMLGSLDELDLPIPATVGLLDPTPIDKNIGSNLFFLVGEVMNLSQVYASFRFQERRVMDRHVRQHMLTNLSSAFMRVIRCLVSLAAWTDCDLFGAYLEKMAYNATRHDHSVEGRLADGGKKY